MRKPLIVLVALFTGSVWLAAQDARTLASDLLEARNPVTAGEWLHHHRGDVFQDHEATPKGLRPESNPLGDSTILCGIAAASAGSLARNVYFRIPDADSLRLPASNRSDPGLLKKCVLSGLTIETDSTLLSNPFFTELKHNISEILGPAQPVQPALASPVYWPVSADSWQGGNDGHNRSRWIIALQPKTRGLAAAAVTAATRTLLTNEANAEYVFMGDLHKAPSFAEASGLPGPMVRQMLRVIAQREDAQHGRVSNDGIDLPETAAFLVRWVTASRRLPPARQAAGLYTADLVLGYLHIPATRDHGSQEEVDKSVAPVKAQLIDADAHFQYDELGGVYSYDHDWLREAFRAAPQSAAGKQAFLFMLDRAFAPGGCASDGFEDVIQRAPNYLHEYSDPGVRAHIFLALGDAYRDRIATANEANGDPFQEASHYKPHVHQNYLEALRYYRGAVNASPGSESAKKALTRAWALLAGIKPLDTRFVCIYD
jgi:hypothetical protein